MKWIRQLLSRWKETRKQELERQVREYEAMRKQYQDEGICFSCNGRGFVDTPPWGVMGCSSCNGTGRHEK